MPTIKDLSGNGIGVFVEPPMNAVDVSTGDYTVLGKSRRLRVTGAGNVIMRSPGSISDITIAANAGESIPIVPGTIIRQTGTTATGMATTSY